jgi:hypothetical protein
MIYLVEAWDHNNKTRIIIKVDAKGKKDAYTKAVMKYADNRDVNVYDNPILEKEHLKRIKEDKEIDAIMGKLK